MIVSKSFTLIVQSLPLFISGTINTLLVTIVAFCIGLSGGIIFGILSCKQYTSWYTFPIKMYVLIIRGTPLYLQLLLMYFALPAALNINISPMCAGIILLGINSIAYVTEIIKSAINAIDIGQWEASYVLGLSHTSTLKQVILPQVFTIVIGPLTCEAITILKETSIVSTIGLCELTRVGMNINARTLDPITTYIAIAAIYLCITSLVTYLSSFLTKGKQ